MSLASRERFSTGSCQDQLREFQNLGWILAEGFIGMDLVPGGLLTESSA